MPTPTLVATTALLLFLSPCVSAGTLWYNGDWNSQTGLSNGSNYQFQDAWIYDDFVAPTSWQVSGLFSNNFFFPGTVGTSARWEIRSGVSSGAGGILVAGGTSTAVATPTGRVLFEQTEYSILVSGLSIDLSPGHYWLSVAPIDSGTGSNPFVSGTNGANCIGSPCGNNASAFYYEPLNPSFQFYPTTNFSSQQLDYSFGVIGTVATIPEPGTSWLFVPIAFLMMMRRSVSRRAAVKRAG